MGVLYEYFVHGKVLELGGDTHDNVIHDVLPSFTCLNFFQIVYEIVTPLSFSLLTSFKDSRGQTAVHFDHHLDQRQVNWNYVVGVTSSIVEHSLR